MWKILRIQFNLYLSEIKIDVFLFQRLKKYIYHMSVEAVGVNVDIEVIQTFLINKIFSKKSEELNKIL